MQSVAFLRRAGIYQKERKILQDIHLSISKAEFVYLIGKTGNGKSSLLKTLWGELPLLEGEGEVDGMTLENLRPRDIPFLRRKLGIVFQDFQLFSEWTVYQNLAFVLEATGWKAKTKIEERIAQVLSDVQLSGKAQVRAFQLSGGEQQRLVMARAILNNPVLILADEPTGNLDPESSDDILHLLRDLALKYKTAILMATHDYRILEKFPGRVYRCEAGRVEEL